MLATTAVRCVLRSFTRSLCSKAPVLDPTQQSFLKERCFLVDDNDNVTGTATKKECHLVGKDGELLLHRAFSVFLFNEEGQLLLQKRSPQKITYPECYTNSCCSHPIADFKGEEEEQDALGAKRAAVRRLNYELGIPIEQIPLDKLHYVTRIHYKDEGDGVWGEHEIDYVFFMKANVELEPNSNEVSEISFVPRKEFEQFIPTLARLTPWFQLIVQHRLRHWWDNLDNLAEITNHKDILKFK